MKGITINAKAIAEGIYALFDEDERAALAFGMLPAVKMRLLEKMLAEKAETQAKDACERQFGFRPEGNVADAEWKKEFVRFCTREVESALYKVAPMVV